MKNFDYRELKQLTQDFMEATAKDPQARIIVANLVATITKEKNKSECASREKHLTFTIANYAYQIILEENISAKEALIKSATFYNAQIEKVLEEKSNKSGRLASNIVREHDYHPVQKDMVKKNTFNKQAIKNSKNVWQMLNLLSDFKQYYSTLIKLEDAIKRIDLLEAKDFMKGKDIEELKAAIGIEDMSPQDKAAIMFQQGFSKEVIAKTFDVNIRTVRRWLN